MAKKNTLKIWLIVILTLLGVVLGINLYVSHLIESKIKAALLEKNDENYTSSVKNVRFQLLDRSVIIDDFEINPTSDAVSSIILKDAPVSQLNKLKIGRIRISGIHFTKLFSDNYLKISKILIKDVSIRHMYNPNVKSANKKKGAISYDSIPLRKLTGLEVKKIELNGFNYEGIDVQLNKKTNETVVKKLTFGEITLEPVGEDLFRLKPIEKLLVLKGVKSVMYNSKYKLEINGLTYDNKAKLMRINDLSFKPIISLQKLATSYRYTKAAFDADVSRIKLYNFNFKKLFRYKSIYTDSVLISGVNINIFKDRRKPFNTKIVRPLPDARLKNMKDTLFIQKVKITDSKLKFEQIMKNKDQHLKVFLHDINAEVTHIASFNAAQEKPLTLDFNAKFMKDADMHVLIDFPMKNKSSLFHVEGTIGKSKFKDYEPAIYPALGIKIIKGDLDHLSFRATATHTHAKGRMTILYHNLTTKVLKSHSREKSKFLSWGVNLTVHSSNPVPGKPTRIGKIDTERVLYKGFIQYIWSMVQSGLVNSLTPVGKTINKVENKIIRDKRKPKKKKKK